MTEPKKKKRKKKYFPNNWKEIKEAPAELFDSLPFDEFMNWKIGGWQLPSNVTCIIRETNYVTGKVKEYTYQRPEAAKKRANQIINSQQSEFLVCNSEQVYHMYPQLTDDYDYDDPLA